VWADVLAESKNYWNLINNRYEEFISDLNRPVLLPEEIFNSLEDVTKLINESEKIEISEEISDKVIDPIFKDSSDQPQKLEKDFDSLLNFKKDELVVHANHGIGKF